MKKNINKVLKYSIRKLSIGISPIVIGTLIFGNYIPGNIAKAGEITFKYVEENELSEKEKELIKREIPEEYKENQTYYLVYKKINEREEQLLPKTGDSIAPLYGLGIGTVVIAAHQKIGLMEKISPIKLYTKVKKSIEKNTNIRYNLIDEN